MTSLATTTKRVTKHPATRSAAWIIGLASAAAAGLAALVYFDEKKASGSTGPAATPGSPAVPGTPPAVPAPSSVPANSVPLWTQLTPVANPQVAGTYMVNIPANATFAFADSTSDPNLNTIIAGLNAAVAAGTVTAPQAYQTGTYAPPFWPSDPFGSNGYRSSGVAAKAFSLVLGQLTSNSPATTPMVWIVTGWTS
jgi:hypothetical protein